MKPSATSFLLILVLWMSCCSSDAKGPTTETEMEQEEVAPTGEGTANVTDVSVSGSENEYNFKVTISSNDTGCEQYADWWEIIDLDGNLLYRRILAHSHVDEQPFTRSGGPAAIDENNEVFVRAHMNTTGYGGQVFKGSIADGFAAATLASDFAEGLGKTAPLPDGCAF